MNSYTDFFVCLSSLSNDVSTHKDVQGVARVMADKMNHALFGDAAASLEAKLSLRRLLVAFSVRNANDVLPLSGGHALTACAHALGAFIEADVLSNHESSEVDWAADPHVLNS